MTSQGNNLAFLLLKGGEHMRKIPKSVLFAVRMTPAEVDAMTALAEEQRTSSGAILRQGLKRLIEESGIMPAVEMKSGGLVSQDRAAAHQ